MAGTSTNTRAFFDLKDFVFASRFSFPPLTLMRVCNALVCSIGRQNVMFDATTLSETVSTLSRVAGGMKLSIAQRSSAFETYRSRVLREGVVCNPVLWKMHLCAAMCDRDYRCFRD